jgi:hypothetical protein
MYGCSDDLIELKGDLDVEFNASYRGSDIFTFSDGTVIEVTYGKKNPKTGEELGVWELRVITQGILFESKTVCWDEDAEVYSDIIYFSDGLKELPYQMKKK